MSGEPENMVLQLLRGLRGDIADVRGELGKVDAKIDRRTEDLRADFRSEMNSLRADVASDLAVMQKETREQIVGLRRAVVEYHSSVIGHGMLITELEERVRRVEQVLNLPPMKSH